MDILLDDLLCEIVMSCRFCTIKRLQLVCKKIYDIIESQLLLLLCCRAGFPRVCGKAKTHIVNRYDMCFENSNTHMMDSDIVNGDIIRAYLGVDSCSFGRFMFFDCKYYSIDGRRLPKMCQAITNKIPINYWRPHGCWLDIAPIKDQMLANFCMQPFSTKTHFVWNDRRYFIESLLTGCAYYATLDTIQASNFVFIKFCETSKIWRAIGWE